MLTCLFKEEEEKTESTTLLKKPRDKRSRLARSIQAGGAAALTREVIPDRPGALSSLGTPRGRSLTSACVETGPLGVIRGRRSERGGKHYFGRQGLILLRDHLGRPLPACPRRRQEAGPSIQQVLSHESKVILRVLTS